MNPRLRRGGYGTGPLATSDLCEGIWDNGEMSLRVIAAGASTAAWADEHWQRHSETSNSHWRWYDILARHSEAFAVVPESDPGRVLALWCATRRPCLDLEGARYYGLAFLEVSPSHRGTWLGPMMMAFVATRALELGCRGIVLQALPEPAVVSWYLRLGGEERLLKGWRRQGDLVPICYGEAATARLAENVNEIRK